MTRSLCLRSSIRARIGQQPSRLGHAASPGAKPGRRNAPGSGRRFRTLELKGRGWGAATAGPTRWSGERLFFRHSGLAEASSMWARSSGRTSRMTPAADDDPQRKRPIDHQSTLCEFEGHQPRLCVPALSTPPTDHHSHYHHAAAQQRQGCWFRHSNVADAYILVVRRERGAAGLIVEAVVTSLQTDFSCTKR